MDTVIGLGKAGCAIAKDFAQYPQYSAYMIDVGLEMTDNTFKLTEHLSNRRL